MDAQARPPLVVVEDDEAHDAVAREIVGAGWLLQHPGGAASSMAVTMLGVADRTDAEVAVLCALRGDGLLVRAAAEPEVIDDLVEDLGKIGPVLLTRGADVVRLDADTWRLLHALASGMTVATAARSLHVSLRTANRRITDARETVGAQTRAQLLRSLTGPKRVRPARNH